MKLTNLADTISFKLSALYLGLFLLSFLVIGLSVYWLTNQTLEQQLKSSIETEANRLKGEYDSGGIGELKDEINEVVSRASSSGFEYGAINQSGQLIAGSLTNFQSSPGWQVVRRKSTAIKTARTESGYLYVSVVVLRHQGWLGVGHTGETIQKAGEAIIQAFVWGFVLVILLGIIGGLYLSGAFLRKIESITKSTQAIIAGDLKHRLPVSKNRDELDNLALLLNQMLDKIGTLLENIQQVSSDIAHDLRTPISHLKFRLEDALKKTLSEEQYKERITFAIEEVDTILNTFSALLRISQIESGSRRSGFKQANFSDIVASVTEALSPVAEEQGKTVQTNIEKSIELIGDKELLTQLTFNLLENAILHTPAHTLINVSLGVFCNRIDLIIADRGQGIAEEHRDKVLQRFYRLEKSRSTPGNGLGLSIVAAIAALHEGMLTLSDNKPGLKVVFSLWRK